MSVDCLMLAAGSSSRMGAWKLLLPWGRSTVIETSLAHAREACARVILVTGHRARDLEERLTGTPRVELVHNPRHELGMFSSIQAGVTRVRTARFFLALADMPMIEPAIFTALMAADEAEVVRPVWDGNPGHPVLLSGGLIPSILAQPPQGSMRSVLAGRRVTNLETSDQSVYLDLDSPEDYERLLPPREM
jgi:molybdenum cofactor cytidylyltransferase